MTLDQLVALARRHGFSDPQLAAAVAMAESGGNSGATLDTVGRTDLPSGQLPEKSIGLWQINLLAHPGYVPWNLTDPNVNAQAAFEVSSGGTNWSPWSTYNSGAYRTYYVPSAWPAIVPPRLRTATGGAVFALSALALAAAAGYAAHWELNRT